MEFLFRIWEWVRERMDERTTWDGGVLIAIGVLILIFQGVIPYAAIAAIVYGAWTIFKKETNK